MKNNHPNRKKDKLNDYELIKYGDGHYVSFKDGQAIKQTIKIEREIYELLNSFELEDISYMNEVSRHYEHSELTSRTLNNRILHKEGSIEDDAIRAIQYKELYKAISLLPIIQKRRLLLYYFCKLTYEEIAKTDGCTKRAVKFSVDCALKHLKNILQNTL